MAEWTIWLQKGVRQCAVAACRPAGSIDAVAPVGGGIEVVGWVALPDGQGQPAVVFVLLGGDPVAKATSGYPRPDVARATNRPDLGNAGFRAVIPGSSLKPFIVDGTVGSVCPTALRVINADGTAYSDLHVDGKACQP